MAAILALEGKMNLKAKFKSFLNKAAVIVPVLALFLLRFNTDSLIHGVTKPTL